MSGLGRALQVSPDRLLALDCFKERLKIPLAEAPASLALDTFEKERRAVLDGFCEYLQHVPLVVAVDEDAQLLQCIDRLVDRADAVLELVVIGRRDAQELHPPPLEHAHGLDDIVRRHRDVLDSRRTVVLKVLFDLRLAPPRGRLIDRELDPFVAVRKNL